MCIPPSTHLFTMVSGPYFPLLISFIGWGSCSQMETLEQSPSLRVARKWKLRLSQLWFQLHFLKVWCQKKKRRKKKKRNLTRYNLADFLTLVLQTECCQFQLFSTVDFTLAPALLIRMQNLFLNQNLCQDDNQFHKGRCTHTRASVLISLCPSLNSFFLFSAISKRRNNEAHL